MPAVSFYIKQEILDALRAKAKSVNEPVSRIISKAVERYISLDEKGNAKADVLKFFSNPGVRIQFGEWEDMHKERSEADADRS